MSLNQQDFYQHLGNKIKHLRTEVKKLTQEEFAERVELSRPSIVNIEQGKQQISSFQLLTFAFELGVSPAELLGSSTEKSDNTRSFEFIEPPIPEEYQEWYQDAR